MIGYKIGLHKKENSNMYEYCLIKLEIPKGAETVKPNNSYKYRCNKAKVVSIQVIDMNVTGYNKFDDCIDCKIGIKYKDVNEAESWIYRGENPTKYIVGEMVRADSLDKNKNKECTNGIHFFNSDETALMFLLDNYWR